MNYRWDKKYLHWGTTALLVIVGGISFYYLLFRAQNLKNNIESLINILMPIIYGLVFAYLMNPIVNKIEKKILIPLLKKSKVSTTNSLAMKVVRGISIFLTLIIVSLFLYGFFALIIPELIKSIRSIAIQLPSYANNLQKWTQELLSDNLELEKTVNSLLDLSYEKIYELLNNRIVPQLNVVVQQVTVSVIALIKALSDALIGLIISVYVLFQKELFAGQLKKTIYSLCKTDRANNIISDIRFIDHTFGGFIIGKIIDSIIIGLLCFICANLFQFPYPILISVIVGITNVIPFFGPFIGAIPSTILILMVNPVQAFYFVIFILVLQQFDGNILGPKILGDSTGLSSFWVIVSITIFGGFFGIVGIAIGVPTFAVIYAFIKRRVHNKLKEKALSISTFDYINLERIEEGEYFKKNVEDLAAEEDSSQEKTMVENPNNKSAEDEADTETKDN